VRCTLAAAPTDRPGSHGYVSQPKAVTAPYTAVRCGVRADAIAAYRGHLRHGRVPQPPVEGGVAADDLEMLGQVRIPVAEDRVQDWQSCERRLDQRLLDQRPQTLGRLQCGRVGPEGSRVEPGRHCPAIPLYPPHLGAMTTCGRVPRPYTPARDARARRRRMRCSP
jgi:hypothetical protein